MSRRFEDTSNLFGRESGSSSGCSLDCRLCGVTHNDGADSDEDPSMEGDSVCYTHFAGLQVCDCCFHRIENEVLGRMPDIIPWFIRIVEGRERQTIEMRELVTRLTRALKSVK